MAVAEGSTDENLKRVSFDVHDDVRFIVYEDGHNSTYSAGAKHPSAAERAVTETFQSTLVSAEIPRSISPPARVDPVISVPLTSPPLPSLQKKMDSETDNPFRPEETLYHEVDPIVEAYRKRPFPPSPTGSPVPPDLTPIKNGRHVTLEASTVIDGNHYAANSSVAPELPPPNSVEVMHVDNKKKKCACCSVQ